MADGDARAQIAGVLLDAGRAAGPRRLCAARRRSGRGAGAACKKRAPGGQDKPTSSHRREDRGHSCGCQRRRREERQPRLLQARKKPAAGPRIRRAAARGSRGSRSSRGSWRRRRPCAARPHGPAAPRGFPIFRSRQRCRRRIFACMPPAPSASTAGPYSMQPFSACTAGILARNAARICSRWPGLAVMMATT